MEVIRVDIFSTALSNRHITTACNRKTKPRSLSRSGLLISILVELNQIRSGHRNVMFVAEPRKLEKRPGAPFRIIRHRAIHRRIDVVIADAEPYHRTPDTVGRLRCGSRSRDLRPDEVTSASEGHPFRSDRNNRGYVSQSETRPQRASNRQ